MQPVRPKVLVVDDAAETRLLVRRALEQDGFAVAEADDAPLALDTVEQEHPDLIILDVMLPSGSGVEVLKALRQTHDVPVIMLTGRDAEADKVLALELGADDYVAKPFSVRELASRVRSVLRRTQRPVEPGTVVTFGELRIDVDAREVFVSGSAVDLTTKEFDLLLFFARAPRRVFSRQQLLERVWDSSSEWQDPATVTEHVRRLRQKLGEGHGVFRTVRGVGYAFEPPR